MFNVLRITDGTPEGTIDLLTSGSGFYLDSWIPNTAEPKDGGIWQTSPFTDGRKLAIKQNTNITDVFNVGIQAFTQDECIYYTQEMRRLLRKASDYWSTNWQNEPVWIEAQSGCESELRYALIMDGRMPTDNEPYQMPFVKSGNDKTLLTDLVLTIEHQFWTAQRPGEADCVHLKNHNKYPLVMWHTPMYANNPYTWSSNSAVFDDLPVGSFTVELNFKGKIFGSAGEYLIYKNNWYVWYDGANNWITCYANFAGGAATLNTAPIPNMLPNPALMALEKHVAITFDGVNKVFKVWFDGADAGGVPVAGIGAYVSDAATDLYMYTGTIAFSGAFFPDTGNETTWTRWSNNIRFVAPFVKPAFDRLPATDANVICITNGWKTYAIGTGGGVVPDWQASVNFNSLFRESESAPNNDYTYPGNLGVKRYLENETTLTCTLDQSFSLNSDRYGVGLDYAFWRDDSAGTYGTNIIDNLPADWLPPVPANADMFFYGCGFYQGHALPNAIIMEFAVDNASLVNYFDVRYYTGAWTVAPDYQIISDANNGHKTIAIIFTLPTNATPTTINGYYGYWVRLQFTVGVPIQNQIVAISAITNPAIEISQSTPLSSVFGDYIAKSRLTINSQVHETDSTAASVYYRRALYALYSDGYRDKAAVAWYTPYLNLVANNILTQTTKPRNQPGIDIVDYSAGGADADDQRAPGAVAFQINVSLAGGSEYLTVQLNENVTKSYQGKYRVFCRMVNTTGGAAKGNVTGTLYVTGPYNLQVGTFNVPIIEELVELGIVDFPGVGQGGENIYVLTMTFSTTLAGPYAVNCYDLILWPADEYNADVEGEKALTATPLSYAPDTDNTIFVLDPISVPKFSRTSIAFAFTTMLNRNLVDIPITEDDIRYRWGLRNSMSFNYPLLQANTPQKYYCLQGFRYTVTSPTVILWSWRTGIVRSWTIEKQEQYESMRGGR